MSTDTIFALATARGKAGISVVRISGPDAFVAADTLGAKQLTARRAALRSLRAANGGLIDEAIVIAYEAPGSFTGENIVEFQLHGSLASINSLIDELARIDGLRLAEPGEFTRRAMENGRLDLSQVEGLADLIEAETECSTPAGPACPAGRTDRAGGAMAAQSHSRDGASGFDH